jgi:hypothetical protein
MCDLQMMLPQCTTSCMDMPCGPCMSRNMPVR